MNNQTLQEKCQLLRSNINFMTRTDLSETVEYAEIRDILESIADILEGIIKELSE